MTASNHSREGSLLLDARSIQTPNPEAVAIADGKFIAVGAERDIRALAEAKDADRRPRGRRAITWAIIDSHMHIIRGGLNYNMELRWDGVRLLADAMRMLKEQVDRTPAAAMGARGRRLQQEHHFAEKRLPTIEELNAVAPNTPVFIFCTFTDRALLNGAALRVGRLQTRDTPNPPGGEILCTDQRAIRAGLLLAQPNATILYYHTLANGPNFRRSTQKNSTRHFMREIKPAGRNRRDDAGGGFQNYPEDYAIIEELHPRVSSPFASPTTSSHRGRKRGSTISKSWSGSGEAGNRDDGPVSAKRCRRRC